ncbi:MAG: hypothetical protein ACW96X_07220 [Promethearchaeota archaeon]|jgi:hypothetical protein
MIGQEFDIIIGTIANYLSIIIIPIMTIFLGIKIFREKQKSGKYNIIRIITCSIFLTLTWILVWEFLYESTTLNTILSEDVTISINTFSFYSFGLGLVITLALGIVIYANQYETLYFASAFIYAGMFITFLLTGYSGFLLPYIFAGGVISVVFLFITGFRLKDNGSLGLAIFASLIFPTLISEKTIVGQLMSIAYPIFGIILALGYFKPFKE